MVAYYSLESYNFVAKFRRIKVNRRVNLIITHRRRNEKCEN